MRATKTIIKTGINTIIAGRFDAISFWKNNMHHTIDVINNNIRFFVIFADKNNIESSWKLKAEYETIHKEVNSFLDSLTHKDVINVDYEYTKEDRVSGKYKTKCFMLIIEK